MKLERLLFYSVRYTSQFSPLVALAGILTGSTWAGFALVFGYYLFVELVLTLTRLGVDSTDENEYDHEDPTSPRWLDHYGVAISGVLLLITTPLAFIHIAGADFTISQLVGAVLSLALVSGTVGGLVGHEYIHRPSRWEKTLGVMVYGVFNYAHFAVSHVYGHHRLIGLHEDWSTSRQNETSYAFFVRAYVMGYIGAWTLTAQDLKRRRKNFWSSENFMLKWTAVQIFAAALVTVIAGPALALKIGAIYLSYSVVSICLSEMVNYLSHYGLIRDRDEAVQLHHSWESANKVTNWFIFNAGKHSEHHTKPTRPHFRLKLGPTSEKLPFGLLLLTVIALVPPLYFWIMNPMVDRWMAARDHERASDSLLLGIATGKVVSLKGRVRVKLLLFAILASSSIASAQMSVGGVGGVDMGGGIRYGGIGGVSIDGHDPYNPYGPTLAEQQRRRDEDEARRRRIRDEDDEAIRRSQDRREADVRERERAVERRENADLYRHASSTSNLVPTSWTGSIISEELEVSSAATGQALAYGFTADGEITAGGFAVVPQKTKAEWLHVEWAQGQDGKFARCYARSAIGNKLAFGGLPIHPRVCESVLPSTFSIEKSGDGKYRCFESSASGLVLNNGQPVNLDYCDQTKPAGTVFPAVIGVGSKGKAYVNSLYAAPMLACLKSSFGRVIQPTVIVPSEKCPTLNLNRTEWRKVRYAATPESISLVKLMKVPVSKMLCTLVDIASNMPVAMQFDESKCAVTK